jgi:hypothetical protein
LWVSPLPYLCLHLCLLTFAYLCLGVEPAFAQVK